MPVRTEPEKIGYNPNNVNLRKKTDKLLKSETTISTIHQNTMDGA